MGKLIYTLNVSLDGYIETPDHGLDWANVDDELHSWFNDELRTIDASLYGRRLYEVMAAYWPTGETDPDSTETTREFARIWNADPKVRLLDDARGGPVEQPARPRRRRRGARPDPGGVRRRPRGRRADARGRVHPARSRRRVPARRPPRRARRRDAVLPAARRAAPPPPRRHPPVRVGRRSTCATPAPEGPSRLAIGRRCPASPPASRRRRRSDRAPPIAIPR